jgi:hypothetical protein
MIPPSIAPIRPPSAANSSKLNIDPPILGSNPARLRTGVVFSMYHCVGIIGNIGSGPSSSLINLVSSGPKASSIHFVIYLPVFSAWLMLLLTCLYQLYPVQSYHNMQHQT